MAGQVRRSGTGGGGGDAVVGGEMRRAHSGQLKHSLWPASESLYIRVHTNTHMIHVHIHTYNTPPPPPQTKYEVWAEARELLEASCDMGDRPPRAMAKEFAPAFADGFAALPAVWWCVRPSVSGWVGSWGLCGLAGGVVVRPSVRLWVGGWVCVVDLWPCRQSGGDESVPLYVGGGLNPSI